MVVTNTGGGGGLSKSSLPKLTSPKNNSNRSMKLPGTNNISPFENPALNKFLHSLTTAPVGNTNQPATGGYSSPDISNYIPTFSDAQNKALDAAKITPAQAVTDPKILQILKEVQTQNAEIKANNGKVPGTSTHHGIFSRVMDVISRPMYAMAEGSKELAESVTSGKSLGSDLAALGHGALQGIEGKDKTDFTQVLQEAQDVRHAKSMGMSGADAVNWAKTHPGGSGQIGLGQKIGGFGLDVVGDPTSYLGVGLVTKPGKALELATEGDKFLQTLKAADKLSPETKNLITGLGYAKGKVGRQAALSSEGKVGNLASNIAKAEGSHKYNEILGQALKDSPGAPTKELLNLAKTAKTNREQEVMSNILDNYNKVTAEAVPRNIAVRALGSKVAVPGVPNIDLMAAAVKGAATKIDPIARTMRIAKKGFQTVAKAFPELHENMLQHFDYGMTQARVRGRELRRALNPLGKDGRNEAWSAFLNGHPSNQIIKLPHGENIEASKWMSGRVNQIKLDTLENGWKAEDYKPWLPNGLELHQGKNDPDWMINSLKNWSVKDGGKAQWFLESAYQKLHAYKDMLASMGDSFGATLPEQHTVDQLNLYNGLKEKGWVSPKGVPELSSHIFPKETADYISQISALMKNQKEWNKFMQRWAKIQQPIKFMLTLPNPSFHIHNAIGDAFINHLDNILPKHYIMSAKVMKHRSSWFEQYNPAENIYPLLSREGSPLSVARDTAGPDAKLFKNDGRLVSADGKIHSHITQAEIYAAYNSFGLRQNYATDLGLIENSPMGVMKNLVDKVTSASEAREDYMRMAHFIGLIERNPSGARTLEEAANFAARRVRQTHFDYTDFTQFEKHVMAQVIPFYKWTRKALPLMTQILFTNPGKAALVPKSLRAMSNILGNVNMQNNDVLPNLENGIVPDWMLQSGYVPIGKSASGYPDFGYISNPLSDMFTQQFGGISQGTSGVKSAAFGMTSPLINDLYEALSNKSTFTGASIVRNTPGSGSKIGQILQYLSSQVPVVNTATQQYQTHGRRDVVPGVSDTAFNWLTGFSAHVDDPRRQKGELLRQRDVGRSILRELKYKHGGKLVHPTSGSGFKKSSTSSGFSGRGF